MCYGNTNAVMWALLKAQKRMHESQAMPALTHRANLSLTEHVLQVLDANAAATIHIKSLKRLLHPVMPFLAVLYLPPVDHCCHPVVISAAASMPSRCKDTLQT